MSPQAGWILQEEVVPRLRSAIPTNVSHIGSEDAEELIQDSYCLAAKLLDHAEKQNKPVTPGNIAYYTILHMKSGRRSTGNSNADVLGSATQLNGRSTTTSFDEPVLDMGGTIRTPMFAGDNFSGRSIFAVKIEIDFKPIMSAKEILLDVAEKLPPNATFR